MIIKSILGVLFVLGLVYLLLPGPTSIKDFKPISGSTVATEWWNNQTANVESFYMNDRRKVITAYYIDEMQRVYCNEDSFLSLNKLFCFVKPLTINHPPEEAMEKIQKEIKSTYLEEIYYPFRESLFLNGYEPFNEQGKPFKLGVKPIIVEPNYYNTHILVRFFPSNPSIRVFLYFLLWIALFLMYKFCLNLFKR